jgi:hypothetical protein
MRNSVRSADKRVERTDLRTRCMDITKGRVHVEPTRTNQGSIVGITIRLRAWRSWVPIPAGPRDFFSYPKRPDRLGPTQPPNLVSTMVMSGGEEGLKLSGREVNHSLRSSAEATDDWSCTSSPVCLHSGDKESLTDQPTNQPTLTATVQLQSCRPHNCVFL